MLEEFAKLGRENFRSLIVHLQELYSAKTAEEAWFILGQLKEDGLFDLVMKLYQVESILIRDSHFKDVKE